MAQCEHLKPWQFKPGQSGYPGGARHKSRAAVMARAIDLAADLGGWSHLGESDRQLLIKAAELSMRPTLRLDMEGATRITNAINRILAGLRKRHAKRPRVDDPLGRPKIGLVR